MNKSGTPSSPYYQFGLLSKEEGLLHFVSSGEQGNCSNLSLLIRMLCGTDGAWRKLSALK